MAFTYLNFIDELGRLLEQGKTFPERDQKADSESFRKWKNDVISIIDQIQLNGFDINCGIASRAFTANGYSITDRDCQRVFDRDLNLTLNEMTFLIDHCLKYGLPKPKTELQNEQKWPSPVTFDWLWRNMPASAWVILVGSFGSGFVIGGFFSGS